MSRGLALLIALVTVSASAQPADSLETPATVSPLDLGVSGLAAGLIAWLATEKLLTSVGAEEGWGLAAYPVGVAAGAYGVARYEGADVSFGRALRGAGVGTLVGYGGAMGIVMIANPSIFSDEDAVVFLGAFALVIAAPVIGAVLDVSPATIRTPSGETFPGVRVRTGL